jgi:HlyD family secretion protein
MASDTYNRFALPAAAVIALVMVISNGCTSEKVQATKDESVPVQVEAVEASDIDVTVKTKGTLAARKEAEVSPKIGGRIAELKVDRGAAVKAGQVVAFIDDSQHCLAWQQAQKGHAAARAGLSSARAVVIQAEAGFEKVESDFQRIRNLWEKRSIARQQYDHAEAGWRAAKAQLNQAREMEAAAEAQAEAAEVAVEMAQTNLDDCRVTAPFSGVITKREINMGEMVTPGTPLFHLETMTNLELRAEVSSKFLSQLHVGVAVRARFESFDEVVELQIDEISPSVDDESRAVEIKCYLDNESRIYATGLYAEVEIILQRKSGVPTVPREALVQENDHTFVYRVSDDIAEKTEVTTGISGRNKIEILSGLQVGDLVVTTGQNNLGESGPVKIAGGGE